jgi:hypothetical protein
VKKAGLFSTLVILVSLAGCGKHPCREYCETAMQQIVDCGLMVDDDDVFDLEVDACVEATEEGDASRQQCEDANENVTSLSCDDLAALVCGSGDPNLTCPE